MELWTDCKQGNMPLSEWIIKVYNLVELCEYEEEFKDRVIRDVLIIGCNSATAHDKIVRKGSKITLDQVTDLLQFEDHFSETVQAYNSHSTGSKDLHYLKYDAKKKAKSKPPSIQKVIHSQNPLQQIQAELATDVKLHIPEDMRKYAKLWRQSAAIARKLDTTRNAVGRQLTFLRNKYTSPVQFPLQLWLQHLQHLQLRVLQHRFHGNTGMKMANSTERSTCSQHLPRKIFLSSSTLARKSTLSTPRSF